MGEGYFGAAANRDRKQIRQNTELIGAAAGQANLLVQQNQLLYFQNDVLLRQNAMLSRQIELLEYIAERVHSLDSRPSGEAG